MSTAFFVLITGVSAQLVNSASPEDCTDYEHQCLAIYHAVDKTTSLAEQCFNYIEVKRCFYNGVQLCNLDSFENRQLVKDAIRATCLEEGGQRDTTKNNNTTVDDDWMIAGIVLASVLGAVLLLSSVGGVYTYRLRKKYKRLKKKYRREQQQNNKKEIDVNLAVTVPMVSIGTPVPLRRAYTSDDVDSDKTTATPMITEAE